jgi:hypothetical protein
MELLRRALLLGCILPGLWLLRLAPLEPLLTILPVDFAARQKAEAAAVPEAARTEAERRLATLPLSVYVEESVQFNVFPATGGVWDRFLLDIDEGIRASGSRGPLFFRTDDEPIRAVNVRLAAAGDTTYVSFSRSNGDLYYQVDRRAFTRSDFTAGKGFTGTPAPPRELLYPFRWIGAAAIAIGLALFGLLPIRNRAGAVAGLAAAEAVALAAAVALFHLPIVAVGGSVQAITRAPLLLLPCWILGFVAAHLYAAPWRTAPDPLVGAGPGAAPAGGAATLRRRPMNLLFLREGLVFLVVAVGPAAFLIMASLALWNR